ncbi:MAG TPA: Gfo/Idh/MocA family oxidoreductase [Devosiaceae bacterium]|jgi:predicted dehydrogenase
MAKRFRVAMIGAGIAARHLSGYAKLPELYEVVVLCSLDAERGKALADQYGVPDYSQDFDAVIGRSDVEIVDIATPPHLHYDMARRAILAGKHVICEKPLFGSLAEVDAMERLLATTDRRLMPIFQYRYGTGLQKLRHLVRKGLTGRPVLTAIETHWWRGADYYDVDWRGKWATELGGGLLGHAIHAHDMLTYIHGDIAEVFSMGATLVNAVEVEDTAALSLRMANGSLASLSMTFGSREEISRLRFCFRDVVAESIAEPYTMYRDPWTFRAGDAAKQAEIDAALAEVQPTLDGYGRQFELLHAALHDGAELPVTLADARRALELVTAAYYSQQQDRPVTLPIAASHPYFASWSPAASKDTP